MNTKNIGMKRFLVKTHFYIQIMSCLNCLFTIYFLFTFIFTFLIQRLHNFIMEFAISGAVKIYIFISGYYTINISNSNTPSWTIL